MRKGLRTQLKKSLTLCLWISCFDLGSMAQASELGHCVYGSVVADAPLNLSEVSVGLMGKKGTFAEENEWVFLDESGAYSFCGLSNGSYKLILSPTQKAQIVFELPFEMNQQDVQQDLKMKKRDGFVDFALDSQDNVSTILSQTWKSEDLLLMPLNPQATSVAGYEPGLVRPAMAKQDLWILGAMPQTVGYRYNDYSWRQPMRGGALTHFDVGGIQNLRLHLGGLDAEHAYGGGAFVEWTQRRLPTKAETQIALHWQPEDTAFLRADAQEQWGQLSGAASLALPLVENKLWFNLNAHYLDATHSSLNAGPQKLQHNEVLFDGALIWHPNASHALRASMFWNPSQGWLTQTGVEGELTQASTSSMLGANISMETQLAKRVTWDNKFQVMWNDAAAAPDNCPGQDCSTMAQIQNERRVQNLLGWNTQSNWTGLHATSVLKVVVPVKEQRWPFKLGALLHHVDAEQSWRLPDTITLYDDEVVQRRISSPQGDALTASQTHFGWFIKPEMRINSYLLLLPGVRWDHLNLRVRSGDPIRLEGLSPRMGFKAYPAGNHEMEIHGGFFQYRDVGVMQLLTQSFTPSDLSVDTWNPDTESWSLSGGGMGDRVSLLIDEGLVLPSLNEGILGLRQGTSAGMSWSVDAVYRQMDNIYAFYENNLQWNESQTEVTGSMDGSSDSHLLLATYQNAYQTYWGVQMRLMGQQQAASQWKLSYGLGNYTGTVADYFDDRGQEYANHRLSDSALPMDVRHQVNFQYGREMRKGLLISQLWHFQTGAPLMRMPDDTLLRTADLFTIQTRLLWRPPVELENRLSFFVDVFNIFNASSFDLLRLANQDQETEIMDPFADPLRLQFGLRYGF